MSGGGSAVEPGSGRTGIDSRSEAEAEAAAALIDRLRERGLTIAVAESLTGGLVAGAITAVAGASTVFRGSVTAYATELKASVLGVDADLLDAHGAVDPDVARQMALGVRRLLGADVGVATTGVAGPAPQDGAPVGLVYVAACGSSGGTVVEELRLSGDRASIRHHAVLTALRLATPDA